MAANHHQSRRLATSWELVADGWQFSRVFFPSALLPPNYGARMRSRLLLVDATNRALVCAPGIPSEDTVERANRGFIKRGRGKKSRRLKKNNVFIKDVAIGPDYVTGHCLSNYNQSA